jgi:hypothetical protein
VFLFRNGGIRGSGFRQRFVDSRTKVVSFDLLSLVRCH